MSGENTDFELVPLRSGGVGIRSGRYDEICHPGVGPREEAERVYVDALGLRRRLREAGEPFVVWDVGLGGGANATAVMWAAAAEDCDLRLVSFDWGPEPLRFAVRHAEALGYFGGLETRCTELVERSAVEFAIGRARVSWTLVSGDFTRLLAGAGSGVEMPAPHAILYDPHSPSANPEMWTLPLFRDLYRRLDPARPCGLATYSRSTAVRVALLLAGFRVGAGTGTATKEETTVAANDGWALERPLDERWLDRVRRSRAAEPWVIPPYGGRPLSEENRARLQEHPQFARKPDASQDGAR